jgi:hypothetical protein
MKKYNIEGNIDFFSELYKSLDDETKSESDINLCLITNQPLIDKFVELTCGHKFNYVPIYNDIYNHKKKFNQMEGKSSSLQVNEIRCPYCRKKQIGVLPYYEELVKEKTNGVNFYDDTEIQCNNCSNQTFYNGKCEFIITPPPNIYIIDNSIKPYKCSSSYVTKLDHDNKSYCYIHNRFMIKKFEKEKKEKEKKLKEELKQKKKEELIQKKNSKEELKQKKKEELIQKKNSKKELKQIVINSKQKISEENNSFILFLNSFVEDENIVVSSNVTINKGCSQIIKSGLNKGNQCGLAILNDCLCKRHYNLQNKI